MVIDDIFVRRITMNQLFQDFGALLVIPRGTEPAKQAFAVLATDRERSALFTEFLGIELSEQRSRSALNEIYRMFQALVQTHS